MLPTFLVIQSKFGFDLGVILKLKLILDFSVMIYRRMVKNQ